MSVPVLVPDPELEPDQETKLIQTYLDQLSPLEKKTYEIAKEHLETSFNIEKSIGFIKWKNQLENTS